MSNAPIIVTAILGKEDFAWLDRLRCAHYPAERNAVAAHLTLFHHLPPSLGAELADRLKAIVRSQRAPRAEIGAVMKQARGVAYRIDSPDLAAIRADLAEMFSGLLTPQDQAGWRPHVTVQNKVSQQVARALHAELLEDFAPRPLNIAGLASHYYRGGPWEPIGEYRFRG